jgi:FAD/FMN-containing dehydrogenase
MTSGPLTGSPALGEATVRDLREELRGELVLPGDAGYDEARSVWNGMIDRHPAMIARCTGANDVIAAIRFARSEGLEVAVRGGGHNVAGNATCDGGLVIDLSPMKGVRVDADARTVRAQGGVTWGELDTETQAFGLATTGGLVTTTGIAGYTLGGGIGWMMRKHGLACDNLISADLVTADGQIVHASESENAELLWGLRGGGGNFGVVTEFEFRLHPVSHVLGGMLAWPAAAGPEVLRFWREWIADTPDELCTMAAYLYAPPEPFVPPEVVGHLIFAIACCHLDPEGSAEDDLQPLRDQGPAVDVLGPIPYPALQAMFDASVPRGSRNYWRSGYVDQLTDGAIETIAAHAQTLPSPMGQLHIHQMGGAVSRVSAGATAFGNRDADFLMNYIGLWEDPAEDEANTAWVRAASDAMAPYGTGARYVNFLADEGEAGVRSAYEQETYVRLQSLKARYDPTNFFHLNQNIKPA